MLTWMLRAVRLACAVIALSVVLDVALVPDLSAAEEEAALCSDNTGTKCVWGTAYPNNQIANNKKCRVTSGECTTCCAGSGTCHNAENHFACGGN